MSLAAQRGRRGGTWRWVGRTALLTAALAALAPVPVWLLGELGVFGDEPLSLGEYGYVLIFCAFGWPLYMLAVAKLASRRRSFRPWAVALSPLVGLPLGIGLLFVNVPEILAGWLLWLSLGALVRPSPRREAEPDGSRVG
jgi:hypothetical protein